MPQVYKLNDNSYICYNVYRFLQMLYWYNEGYKHGNGYGFTHGKFNLTYFPVMARVRREWKK